jgi:hypothetical protein
MACKALRQRRHGAAAPESADVNTLDAERLLYVDRIPARYSEGHDAAPGLAAISDRDARDRR